MKKFFLLLLLVTVFVSGMYYKDNITSFFGSKSESQKDFTDKEVEASFNDTNSTRRNIININGAEKIEIILAIINDIEIRTLRHVDFSVEKELFIKLLDKYELDSNTIKQTKVVHIPTTEDLMDTIKASAHNICTTRCESKIFSKEKNIIKKFFQENFSIKKTGSGNFREKSNLEDIEIDIKYMNYDNAILSLQQMNINNKLDHIIEDMSDTAIFLNEIRKIKLEIVKSLD